MKDGNRQGTKAQVVGRVEGSNKDSSLEPSKSWEKETSIA